MTIITNSPEETEALGKRLALQLAPGDVLALFGGLGAGKTTFVRGLAKGLNIQAPVSSPTYTIVNEYEGEMPLFHFDMYRLSGSQELFDIGWEDYLTRGGVIVVEWSEIVQEVFDRQAIKISFIPHGQAREITIQAPPERGLEL